jgi:hypothetical protein
MCVLLDAQPMVDDGILGTDHPGGTQLRILRQVGVSPLDGDGVEELKRGDLEEYTDPVDCIV